MLQTGYGRKKGIEKRPGLLAAQWADHSLAFFLRFPQKLLLKKNVCSANIKAGKKGETVRKLRDPNNS